jgi:class 3 adenylate cyclase/pimeloyl-ACP methyl ester carboxylesterase
VAETPVIRYLKSDGKDLAYQVAGAGSVGIVNVLELTVHLDLLWADPAWANQFERFGSLWRMALFQLRGVGLSEPVERRPTVEEQAEDIGRVMDAAGLDRAIVFGSFSTAPGAVVFAALHPERVQALLLFDPIVSGPLADDPDLGGWRDAAEAHAWAEIWLSVADRWGTGAAVEGWNPVIISPRTLRQVGLLERTGASRPVARAYVEATMRADVSRIAPQVRAPTRVLHLQGNPLPEAVARHAASLFPDGELDLIPPSQAGMSWGESFVSFFEYLAETVSGRAAPASDRLLATVLFEDVVGSTTLISKIGDEAWGRLRLQRDRLVANCVEALGGRIISTAGDGSMCSLPGPAAAIQCAERLHDGAASLGLQLRVGIHSGECERIGNDLSGLAIHIAARIGSAAAPGETFVSRTVADLVAGSELRFDSRGLRELKGVPGQWEILAAAKDVAAPTAPAEPPRPRLGDRVIVAAARRAPRLLSALNRLEQATARHRT